MTGTRRVLLDLVVALVLVTGIAFAVTRWVAIPWVVRGDSMEPALRAGDRVVVDLWSYRTGEPRPGDIALLIGPEDVPLVKRVAETPAGERPLARWDVWGASDEPAYPVLGDNVSKSLDSREFGPVPRSRFRGKIVYRYWPLSRAGPLRGG